MFEEMIALAVFVGLGLLALAGWAGMLPRGVRELLGEEEGEGPTW